MGGEGCLTRFGEFTGGLYSPLHVYAKKNPGFKVKLLAKNSIVPADCQPFTVLLD